MTGTGGLIVSGSVQMVRGYIQEPNLCRQLNVSAVHENAEPIVDHTQNYQIHKDGHIICFMLIPAASVYGEKTSNPMPGRAAEHIRTQLPKFIRHLQTQTEYLSKLSDQENRLA